jgi:hypothetical protein
MNIQREDLQRVDVSASQARQLPAMSPEGFRSHHQDDSAE